MPRITALEIGTTSVKVLMVELDPTGDWSIVGWGECASQGIHKGQVIDFEEAEETVRHALREAESQAKHLVGEHLYLAASGGSVDSFLHRAEVLVLNEEDEPGSEIIADDLEHVLDVARKIPLADDRVRLHTLCQGYEVDGRGGIENPIRLTAQQLAASMLLIHGHRSTVENLKKLVKSVPIECADAAFSGYCSALAVLSDAQKKGGAVVIDLGGGTTDYLVYSWGKVKFAGSVPIGGNHLTMDVCRALNLNFKQAESLKKASGSAMINPMEGEQSYFVPAEDGFPGCKVRSITLQTILHARMEELFELIAEQIHAAGLSDALCAGVFLTGGGSALNGVVDLAQQVFNAPAQVGQLNQPLDASISGPAVRFAAVSGAVRYAIEQFPEVSPDRSRWGRWWSKLWGGSRG